MTSYLIDTNVVLRSVESASAEHPAVVSAVAALLENGEELFVAPQVLVEFWVVATRPLDANGFGWSIEKVRDEIGRLLDQFSLLPEIPALFEAWLRLVTDRQIIGKRAHDARLAALLTIHGIANILTFNTSDFKDFGIIAVSPDEILAK
jgi:predicted nucleic acid-binding protein